MTCKTHTKGIKQSYEISNSLQFSLPRASQRKLNSGPFGPKLNSLIAQRQIRYLIFLLYHHFTTSGPGEYNVRSPNVHNNSNAYKKHAVFESATDRLIPRMAYVSMINFLRYRNTIASVQKNS